jgi:gliding motility-associated-like protein
VNFGLKHILTILLLLSIIIEGKSQSPELNCVSVAPNGNVSVNWTANTNLGSMFVRYNIYSDVSGTFTQVGTETNVASSIFTHVGAGADLSSVSYFVTIVYNDGVSDIELPAVDTLSTLYLSVNNPGNGTAVMNWNDLSDPISPNNGNYYYIQRELPVGVWNTIDSVLISDANTYTDTIALCSATVNYQVYLINSEGCQSLSSIDGDLFQDLVPPATPDFNYITVDSVTGNAILDWNPSASGDAQAYIILQNINGGWVIIDTVYGYNNTYYENLNSNADLLGETYAIAAFDSCWNGNPPSPNTSSLGVLHKTLFLKNSYNVCAIETTLRWNSYVNWNTGVGKYEIFRSDEGGTYNLINTITTGDTTFKDNNLIYLEKYCYIIRAVSGNFQDTAISNISCRTTNQPPSPKFAYLQNVSVEDEIITIKLHPDIAGITKEVEVFRSYDGTQFDSFVVETNISSTMTILDEETDELADVAFYKYVARDSCNNEILTSNISNNILLTVEANSQSMVNFLQWNAYKNWNGNLLGYNIYRSINGDFDDNPIATVSSNQLYFEDNISNLIGTNANGAFCYYVEAIESMNGYGFSEKAKSNVACDEQNPLVFIPNAMVLGGYNDLWMPVINMIDVNTYSARVYTRFGEVIFESNSPTEGWDGTYKNKEVMLGVYVYQVVFNAGNNSYHDIRGTVTVIR